MIQIRRVYIPFVVLVFLLSSAYSEGIVSTSFDEPQGELTLAQSLALALERNPELAPFE